MMLLDLIKEFIFEFLREMQKNRFSAKSEQGENERRLAQMRKTSTGC